MNAAAPFATDFYARWPDMDFNQHMRNAAFLGYAEDARLRYLYDAGWTPTQLAERRIGPVVLEDRLVYKRELGLLEPFRVELALAAITSDGRRMKIRNRFLKHGEVLAAEVESVVLWLDLDARKPVAPPDELRDLWKALAHTSDFVEW
jgi:acyl-CoA thioester hydrolase